MNDYLCSSMNVNAFFSPVVLNVTHTFKVKCMCVSVRKSGWVDPAGGEVLITVLQ